MFYMISTLIYCIIQSILFLILKYAVQGMIGNEDYEMALKYIDTFKLAPAFPLVSIVQKLVDFKKVSL